MHNVRDSSYVVNVEILGRDHRSPGGDRPGVSHSPRAAACPGRLRPVFTFVLCRRLLYRVSRQVTRPRLPSMGTSDDHLDATSRNLLNEIDEMKRLEREKRHEARSSDEFHELAGKVEQRAKHVFQVAHDELVGGEQDSPIAAERDEQHPGDWTEGNRN